ncbi:MAG TPA: hypothetical protein DD435_11855 [Cyanobacteria bacterium UBA8530]|nr:hypothetical protein [Cyanobacteria bacterium UBA8530]
MISRWWIYQRERFPLAAHGLLIAAFSFSTLSFSSMLRSRTAFPTGSAIIVAFFTLLFFFMQLRIADEHKDADEDKQFRPYLPVPRGVISLKELRGLFLFAMIAQIGLALWLKTPPMVFLLILVWVYLGLMGKEFFVRQWLKERPFTYMWTHMFIMPLTDLYASSCDWMVKGSGLPVGFVWFLATSFFNGMILEIGRKIRAPEDEEEGVTTYSSAWGKNKAVLSWLCALSLTFACALGAASRIGFIVPIASILGPLFLGALFIAYRYLKKPAKKWAKLFELFAGIWTLVMYLSLGVLPRLIRF